MQFFLFKRLSTFTRIHIFSLALSNRFFFFIQSSRINFLPTAKTITGSKIQKQINSLEVNCDNDTFF